MFLDRPNDALGIRAMHLLLMPTAAGFDYRASGGSKLGPFTSNGRILLPHNAADGDRDRCARRRRSACER